MTPAEAREFMKESFGPARARTVITKLADQVERLTKERDSIAACYEAREEEAHQLSERIIKLTRERDALAANHKDCVKCLGEALQDRADLAAAAKLALSNMVNVQYAVSNGAIHADVMAFNAAIEAMSQAGVQ